jgi:hypothetical protein
MSHLVTQNLLTAPWNANIPDGLDARLGPVEHFRNHENSFYWNLWLANDVDWQLCSPYDILIQNSIFDA